MKPLFLLLSLNILATSISSASIGEPLREERIECPGHNPNASSPVTLQIYQVDGKWSMTLSSYASAFRRPLDPLVGVRVDNYFVQGNSYTLYSDLNDLNDKGHRRMTVLKFNRRTRSAEISDTDYPRPIQLGNCRWFNSAFH